jgi:uncharacterized protein YneF (UPF0154 family)
MFGSIARPLLGKLFRWGVAHAMEEAQQELAKNPRIQSEMTEVVAAQVTAALKGRLPK